MQPDMKQKLGEKIITGGLAMVSADEALYGDAATVVMAQGRMFEMLHGMADKSGADITRRMLAHRLGDLPIAALYGGDVATILMRVIAEVARIAPVIDLKDRAAVRGQLDGLQKALDEGRTPAPATPALQPPANDGEAADKAAAEGSR